MNATTRMMVRTEALVRNLVIPPKIAVYPSSTTSVLGILRDTLSSCDAPCDSSRALKSLGLPLLDIQHLPGFLPHKCRGGSGVWKSKLSNPNDHTTHKMTTAGCDPLAMWTHARTSPNVVTQRPTTVASFARYPERRPACLAVLGA